MKIAIVVNSLGLGGSEQVTAWLSEVLAERGHEVSLITVVGAEADFYSLSPDVRRISLDLGRVAATPLHSLWNVAERALALRRALNPDEGYAVAVSFADKTNILMLLAMLGRKSPPLVISEQGYLGWMGVSLRRALARLTYPLALKVVSVSDGVDASLAWLPAHKRVVIYNPVRPAQSDSAPHEVVIDTERKNIVTAGRLSPAKNYPLLIRAFGRIAEQFPDWDLSILGVGELEAELAALIQAEGLSGRAFLRGQVKDVYPTLQAADLFVLSSLYEGMPLALIEAMGCGLPIITTNYQGDPHGLVTDGHDGLIVPSDDVETLAAVICDLLADPAARAELGANARHIRERLAPQEIANQWEALLMAVAKV